MKIILIGYMGSGKSSVGKKLASVLNLPFKDLDTEIEQSENLSVSEIFSQKGEIYFRKTENKVLKTLLKQAGSFVLATGGGTPCYADSLTFMLEEPNTILVYLKNSLEVLTNRLLLEKEHRPLLAHLNSEEEVNDFIRKHLFERTFYYNQANIIVESSAKNIAETTEEIVGRLF
ncbi:shikimate kinase [Aequorivita marisscotiae]|uniref:Shikimate kinase n=1 Tax=Aequorivita marisscotiae TaxID=3040348 RepID=A0ABY8KT74_9FLAO|nr:shikimate kinase [Aequorivita sp. Ant34-E75]WGF92640.1 shikimate kinase [Aequorivita sp. Ant34-E75]